MANISANIDNKLKPTPLPALMSLMIWGILTEK